VGPGRAVSLHRRLDRLARRLALRHGPDELADMEARLLRLEARANRGDDDAERRLARVRALFALARDRRDHRHRRGAPP
jgi:hypothetical protein